MRNMALDIMKAIGILLVIIGHNTSGVGYHYIYSFHMPMFFIIAGYLWKERNIWQSLSHDLKRILLPYLTYFLVVAVGWYIFRGVSVFNIEQDFLKVIWGSYDRVDVLGHHVQGVGFLWFLPALYVCKNVFNVIYVGWKWLNERQKLSYVCMYVCMFAGILIHTKLFPLPFALTTGFNALGYFSIGQIMRVWLKDISVLDNIAWYYKLAIVLVFAMLGWYTMNGMGTCSYSIFPLDYIAGVSGTIVCYYISKRISKINWLGKIIAIVGQYTISILLIYQFINDYAWLVSIDYSKHVVLMMLTILIALIYVFSHYTVTRLKI